MTDMHAKAVEAAVRAQVLAEFGSVDDEDVSPMAMRFMGKALAAFLRAWEPTTRPEGIARCQIAREVAEQTAAELEQP